MRAQACGPCAKRKVRCDHEEPCSNCKRRKQDVCTYPPEVVSLDRIRQLEAAAQRSEDRRSQEDNHRSHSTIDGANPRQLGAEQEQGREAAHAILKEVGEDVMLEPHGWRSGVGHPGAKGKHLSSQDYSNASVAPSYEIRAFQSILVSNSSTDMHTKHPAPQNAELLWTAFEEKVHPLIKICFDWEIADLHEKAISRSAELTTAENAFVFSIYLIGAFTLTEEECLQAFSLSRLNVLSEFQLWSEQALASANFLDSPDLMVLQALALYMVVGMNRVNTKSLWSLMGLVIRNAERLGLHQDGIGLELRPVEIERRRRIWWQLQHLDLGLSIWSGYTSLTLLGEWTTKLPLNIEDDDISPESTGLPPEREGLTGMSFCLWSYWVLREQRSFRSPDGHRLGISWVTDGRCTVEAKRAFLKRLERGLNSRFVQHCDPIQPYHILVHIGCRQFISAMQRFVLHPAVYPEDPKRRAEFLDICIKNLEYDIAIHSLPSIAPYRWRLQSFFQWSALIYILIEVTHLDNVSKADRIWSLLAEVYATKTTLFRIADDLRRANAAELIIAAWKAYEGLLARHRRPARPRPPFVAELEARIAPASSLTAHDEAIGDTQLPRSRRRAPATSAYLTPNSLTADLGTQPIELDDEFLRNIPELNFDDIDWAFWSGFDSLGG